MPIKFANAKKLHRKLYAFFFVCCLPLLLVTAFCLGHPQHFTKTNFSQLSSFCMHSSGPRCNDQLPEDAVISLCNLLLHHSQHHHGGSPPFPPWFICFPTHAVLAALQTLSLFSISTTRWASPPFYLSISSTPEVSPLFILPFFPPLPLLGRILCRPGQFPVSFISHLQRTWVKLVSFPQTKSPAYLLSSKHTFIS